MSRQIWIMAAAIFISFGASPSFASDAVSAVEVKAEFQNQLDQMSANKRGQVKAQLEEILAEAEEQNLLQTVANGAPDRRIRAFVCVQAQAGIGLVAGHGLACVNTDGDTFSMTSLGAFEFTIGGSGGVALGYHIGPAVSGINSVELGAGLHFGLGGSVLITGDYRLLNLGVGAGITLKYGVPRDSLFGGQVETTVLNK